MSAGEVIGPTGGWNYNSCLPFVFRRSLADTSAWELFKHEFSEAITDPERLPYFRFLGDTSAPYAVPMMVAMSFRPDMTPTGLAEKKRSGIRFLEPTELPESDSCLRVKAEVDRVHYRNMIAYLNGDTDTLRKGFTAQCLASSSLPTSALRSTFHAHMLPDISERSRRLPELFLLDAEEMYVNGNCGEQTNQKYLMGCRRLQLQPQSGDVFVYWPSAPDGFGKDVSLIYRKIDGVWKIAAVL